MDRELNRERYAPAYMPWDRCDCCDRPLGEMDIVVGSRLCIRCDAKAREDHPHG